MSPNYSTQFESVREKVSPDEWQARVDVAACYRLMDKFGMTDLIYNHITLRIPGTEHLLINLCGMLYKEITASSLVKIDVESEIICKPGTRRPYGELDWHTMRRLLDAEDKNNGFAPYWH